MNTQKTLTPRAWADLLLLGLLWGASFLSIRIALNEVAPITTVAHRTLWAALALWLYVVFRRLSAPKDIRIWAAFLGMGLLNNVIPFSLMAWGQLHIETGLTSILNAATAIWGVLIAALFLADERLTLRKSLGVCVGFTGVVVVIGIDNLTKLSVQSLAQLAVIAGTLSYAFAGVWARKFLSSLAPPVAAAGMLTGASLIVLPLAYIVEGPPTLMLSLPTWGAIGYYALLGTAGAYLLYYRVLAVAGSGNLMLVTLIIPPVAITLGALVLGETLSSDVWLGFALLALGLIIIDGRLFRHA